MLVRYSPGLGELFLLENKCRYFSQNLVQRFMISSIGILAFIYFRQLVIISCCQHFIIAFHFVSLLFKKSKSLPVGSMKIPKIVQTVKTLPKWKTF